MLVVAFMTNDRQVLSRFCLLVDFVQFLLGTNFVCGAPKFCVCLLQFLGEKKDPY